MTRDEAENIATAAAATGPLRGNHRITGAVTQEALQGNWIVLVYLDDNPEPCVLGNGAGCQAWLDANGKEAPEEILMAHEDSVARRLIEGVNFS